jgi:hypothetical protein
MSEAIFNSFIESVYSGGSALELFDSNIEVIGGVDDITVDSIFGGLDDETGADTTEDEAASVGDAIDDEAGADTIEDDIMEDRAIGDKMTGGVDYTMRDEAVGGADKDSDAIITSVDIALPVGVVEAPIVSSVNIPIQVVSEKNDTVTASDVASLLNSFI